MRKFCTLIILSFIAFTANAQILPFGVIDTADLNLASCDFEKDAHAEVLFNYCVVHYDGRVLVREHHKRLKIFNLDASKDLASIVIETANDGDIKMVDDLQAETFNLKNGKIAISKLDKKSFYKQKVDKWTSKISFTFPALQNGSVIEYAYTETYHYVSHMPDWYFQGELPVRQSQCNIKVPKGYTYLHKLYTNQELTNNSDSVVSMANVPSLVNEPYMDTYFGNLQRVSFALTSTDGSGKAFNVGDTWQKIGSMLMYRDSYGQQLNVKVKGEEGVVAATKDLSPEQKIAWIFKMVRDTMLCDENGYYPYENIAKAWNRKSADAAHINMILCRLLDQAGLDANLLAVSKDEDERVLPANPTFKNLDKTVVHVKVNDTKYYVLDASEKKNLWNQIPYGLLNTFGLYMNIRTPAAGLIFIEDRTKARNAIFINADILPAGKMMGTAQISHANYNRVKALKAYNKDGEKKYIESLRGDDNNLKVDTFKIENLQTDTLPLQEKISFTLNMPDADENYIYLNPKVFAKLNNNPFTNKTRIANIDFNYSNNYFIGGRYKIPKGFKVEALPKNMTMLMPDGSIRFKQQASVDDDSIVINYTIDYNKSYFMKDEYPALFEFFKKMYEMLNEQIVLKKTQ